LSKRVDQLQRPGVFLVTQARDEDDGIAERVVAQTEAAADVDEKSSPPSRIFSAEGRPDGVRLDGVSDGGPNESGDAGLAMRWLPLSFGTCLYHRLRYALVPF
jgi:hypothetical protein